MSYISTSCPPKNNQTYYNITITSMILSRRKKLYCNGAWEKKLTGFHVCTICYWRAKIATAGKQPRKINMKMQTQCPQFKKKKKWVTPWPVYANEMNDVCNLKIKKMQLLWPMMTDRPKEKNWWDNISKKLWLKVSWLPKLWPYTYILTLKALGEDGSTGMIWSTSSYQIDRQKTQ